METAGASDMASAFISPYSPIASPTCVRGTSMAIQVETQTVQST